MNKVKVKELINRILDANDFDELRLIGREIFEMEDGYEKRMIISVYKEKKITLLNMKKSEDSLFSDIYWLIVSPSKSFNRIGKLLYRLKDSGLLSKSELNLLFEIYDKKKEKIEKEEEIVDSTVGVE